MRLNWMTSAALALGISAVTPVFAKADYHRDYRDRDDHREVYRDRHEDRCVNVDVVVDVRDLPGCVLDTIRCELRGRPLVSVQFVRRDGSEFYRVRIDNRRDLDQTMLVAPNGRLINAHEEAVACAPDYRRELPVRGQWHR